jgi:Bacterial regulatory proteins, luxR family
LTSGEIDPLDFVIAHRIPEWFVQQPPWIREIGETLFMSEKTASVHVSRILAKLDVGGRVEAAAVAHRLGLTAGSRQA